MKLRELLNEKSARVQIRGRGKKRGGPGFSPDLTVLKAALLAAALLMIVYPFTVSFWYYAGLCFALGLVFALVTLLATSVKKIDEWERGIVLRFGRFKRVLEPGLRFLLPVADRLSRRVDIRVRVSDFSAQEILTRDSVTVNADAFAFWLVWDPQKAVLEVADYEDAVILSAKTALRNAISSHDLTAFLERGEAIEAEMRDAVDKKTDEWGVTVQHIEITDIQIPDALQESLARLAQAEREKKARVLLAQAEIAIAHQLQDAVSVYAGNESAMKLKILSIINEGLKAGNSMMLVPNSITEALGKISEQ